MSRHACWYTLAFSTTLSRKNAENELEEGLDAWVSKLKLITNYYLSCYIRVLKCSEYVKSLWSALTFLLLSSFFLFRFFPRANNHANSAIDEANCIHSDRNQKCSDSVWILLWCSFRQELVIVFQHDCQDAKEYYSSNHQACAVDAAAFCKWVHFFFVKFSFDKLEQVSNFIIIRTLL